ncbi:hypothetical protein PV341_12200 [Streptomyces sp. PA03-1a]|nr:hypothetical protein [Streptomyces sp. PA03-1a]
MNNADEYKPARRTAIRKILVDVAVNVVSNMLVAGLAAAAHMLF